MKQVGTVVTGTQLASANAKCTISGSIVGTTLNMYSECPSVNYSSNSVAQTDGLTMSGTFLDSQSTAGTFSATKTQTTLAPDTQIQIAPQVSVQGKTAKFQLQKFTKVSLSKLNSAKLRSLLKAKAPKLTFQYELSIKGAEKRKLVSKRNAVTAKNLKPGNYTSDYKLTAFKDGKKAFSTKASPITSFTVAP